MAEIFTCIVGKGWSSSKSSASSSWPGRSTWTNTERLRMSSKHGLEINFCKSIHYINIIINKTQRSYTLIIVWNGNELKHDTYCKGVMVVSNVMTRKINNFAVLVSMSIFNVPLKMNEMSVEIRGSGFEELLLIREWIL